MIGSSRLLLGVVFTLGLLFYAVATYAETCVTNGTDHPHLFVIAAKDQARISATLASGEGLCHPAPNGAILSVFADSEAIEGCSRLAKPGKSDTLLSFAEFDRCRWASQEK